MERERHEEGPEHVPGASPAGTHPELHAHSEVSAGALARAARDPEQVAAEAIDQAAALRDRGEALAALRKLVETESTLATLLVDAPISAHARHTERALVHALLKLREHVDRAMPLLRRAVRFPEDLRPALALEVERALALSRAFVELGWFTHGAALLGSAELPLGYLGEAPALRFDWLRQRASWAFAARELEEARRAVREYHELLRRSGLANEDSAPPLAGVNVLAAAQMATEDRGAVSAMPAGEIARAIDELQGWLEVAPVRALVADLGQAVIGDPALTGRLLAWDIASTLFFPWDEALSSELERRLATPTLPVLEALVDRIGESLEAVLSPDQLPRPALIEDGGRVLRLLDRIAELAVAAGSPGLALRARLIAHEQMLDVLAAVREDALEELHTVDAARAREILAAPPWSEIDRARRLSALESTAAGVLATEAGGRARAAIVADPLLSPERALEIAGPALEGALHEPAAGSREVADRPPAMVDDERLELAAALVDRSALSPRSRRDVEAPTLALARRWLEAASQADDRALAMEAKEILAGAHELAGDPGSALVLFEELATYFEARDHERWVNAIERCATLAKQTGRLAAAGRAARSGFRPGGRVQAPAEDLPRPEDPREAEEQAERAIAVALRTTDPEIGEAWLRRALLLNERVPDGRRREDEIWERIADLWQAEADALFEEGDASSEDLDEAHHRAHEALVRAIEVNEHLGDGERVFDLSGRVLEVLWTWLTRWEDALEAFIALARGRFRSAIARGDLEHAVAARLELRGHLAELHADAQDADSDVQPLIERFEELEREMAQAVEAETARLREPWWGERLERREALLRSREVEDEGGD